MTQKLRYLENKIKKVARGDEGADELRQLILKHKLLDVDQRTELPASQERAHRPQQRKNLKLACKLTFYEEHSHFIKLSGGFFATQAKRKKTVLKTINTKRCARPDEIPKTKSKLRLGLESAPGARVW